jgi:hypothetical protein
MAYASGTFTDASVADTETVTVGGKTYTFQATLTDVDGNVDLGANNTEALANLAAAINLGAGAGTAYAASMTENPLVRAISSDATTLVVRSKVEGAIGNQIASTEAAGGSWGAATLTGGSGDLQALIRAISIQAPAGIKQALIDLTDPEGDE